MNQEIPGGGVGAPKPDKGLRSEMGSGECLSGEVTLRGFLSNGEERSLSRVALRRQLWAEGQHTRAKALR